MAVTTAAALLAAGTAGLGVAAARQDRKSAEKSVESAERQRDESQAFIEKSIKQARGDLFKLFPSAQESAATGLQAGLDVFGQTVPQQLQAFQGGNVAAQQQLIQGLQPQRAAILGQEVNFDPQATQLGLPEFDFNTPQFGSIGELGLQGGAPQDQLQGLDPQLVQQLIAEFQASQGVA